MERLSDRARKLFERVVDIVANDIVQERPNSVLHTPHHNEGAKNEMQWTVDARMGS